MYNQLKIEFYKLKTSIMYYLMLVLFAVIGVSYGIIKFVPGDISGGQGFINTIGDTSFIFILTLFVCYFVGSDFSNRTIHNDIKIGYSRLSVVLTRGIVVLPAVALSHLVYVFSTAVSVGIINGLGTEMSIQSMIAQSVLVFIQIMTIQSFSLLIMFLCKKSSLGMVLSVCFTFLTCNILRNFLGEENFLFKITSFYRIMMDFQSLTTNEILLSFTSAIVTLIIIFCVTHIAFRKAELK